MKIHFLLKTMSLPIHNWKKEFYEGIGFVEVKCQVPFLRLVFRELQ